MLANRHDWKRNLQPEQDELRWEGTVRIRKGLTQSRGKRGFGASRCQLRSIVPSTAARRRRVRLPTNLNNPSRRTRTSLLSSPYKMNKGLARDPRELRGPRRTECAGHSTSWSIDRPSR